MSSIFSEDEFITMFKEIEGDPYLYTSNEIEYVREIYKDSIKFKEYLSRNIIHDVLHNLFLKGPVYDGDICSKSGRDTLLDHGYCVKVIVKGEQGYNALNYKGGKLLKIMNYFKDKEKSINKE